MYSHDHNLRIALVIIDSMLEPPDVGFTVALKVSPQGHVSGRSPQSSGSSLRLKSSVLRVVATVLRVKSQVEVSGSFQHAILKR